MVTMNVPDLDFMFLIWTEQKVVLERIRCGLHMIMMVECPVSMPWSMRLSHEIHSR